MFEELNKLKKSSKAGTSKMDGKSDPGEIADHLERYTRISIIEKILMNLSKTCSKRLMKIVLVLTWI